MEDPEEMAVSAVVGMYNREAGRCCCGVRDAACSWGRKEASSTTLRRQSVDARGCVWLLRLLALNYHGVTNDQVMKIHERIESLLFNVNSTWRIGHNLTSSKFNKFAS